MEESEVRRDVTRHRTSSSSTEMSEEQLHAAIGRILCVNWKEESENSIYLPETAEMVHETTSILPEDLISQSIYEVISQISSGKNPTKNIVQVDTGDSSSLNSVSPTQNLSPMLSPVSSCPVPLLPLPTTSTNTNTNKSEPAPTPPMIALIYLTDSYTRVSVEERNHPKKSSTPPLSDILSDIRMQLVHYTSLILQGFLLDEPNTNNRNQSILIAPLLSQAIPRGFIPELIARTHSSTQIFSKIFTPVLQGLFLFMQQASIVGNEHRQPIQVHLIYLILQLYLQFCFTFPGIM